MNAEEMDTASGWTLRVPVHRDRSPGVTAEEMAAMEEGPSDLYGTGGVKADTGKPMLDLISPAMMFEVGRVLTFGAQKYDPHNWRKGIKYSRLIAAALRHIFKWLAGHDKDDESGLSHLAHSVCCLMMLIEYQADGRDDELNDRHRG